MKTIKNIPYTVMGHPRHVLDVHLPEEKSFPVFVYFHGGGLVGGSKEQGFIPDLVKKGVAVVSANYRLYPECSYPDFIKDAAATVAWAKNNISEHGTVTGLYVGGSSAGGYLTQMLCFDKRYLSPFGIDADSFSGYLMDAGQPTVHFNVLRERGLDQRRVIIDEAAPIFHITDTRNYPPMQIIVSDNDMENRFEQTMLLVSTLKHFGHTENVTLKIMKNSSHCSYVSAFDEKGNSLFASIVSDFIQTTQKKGENQ